MNLQLTAGSLFSFYAGLRAMFWIQMFVHVLADDWGARPDNSRPRNWGFPKIGGTFLGVPLIRITIFGGLY